MKLQAKSLFSSRAAQGTKSTKPTPGPSGSPLRGISQVSNLQALAAELHQSSTQGLFQYPRNWMLIAKVTGILFIAFSMLRLLLLVRTVLQTTSAGLPLERSGVSAMQLAGAVLSVLLAVLLASVLINLFPAIRVTPQGLGISQLFGWRRIPWSKVGVLRVMEVAGDRYVVMIPFKGSLLPATPAPVLRLIPVLVGAAQGGERGLIITSHIQSFDRLIQLIVSYMAQAAGQNVPRAELFLDESAVMPLARLVFEPEAGITYLARYKPTLTRYGMPEDEVEPEVAWRKVLPRQFALALPPALLLLLSAALQGGSNALSWGHLVWAVALLGLGVAELPFIAKLVQTVGDMMVGSGQFKRSVWAYPELQTPRAVLVALGLALLAIGLPPSSAQLFWLAGIGITTWYTVRFVQRVYFLELSKTLLAAVGSFLYQIALLALYIGVS